MKRRRYLLLAVIAAILSIVAVFMQDFLVSVVCIFDIMILFALYDDSENQSWHKK